MDKILRSFDRDGQDERRSHLRFALVGWMIAMHNHQKMKIKTVSSQTQFSLMMNKGKMIYTYLVRRMLQVMITAFASQMIGTGTIV